MTGRWKAALQIAEARRPRGEVAMTELMMMSQTVIEMGDEIKRLRAALADIKGLASVSPDGEDEAILAIAREALRHD